MSETRIFTVNDEHAGIRLDKFLALQMPEFSRSEIQKFRVTKQGLGIGDWGLEKFSNKVKTGDEYSVEIPEHPIPNSQSPVPSPQSPVPTDIIFEDDDIIVVNKPRGVVMYPAAGNHTGTLVQNILAHTHLSALGGGVRPGVVHRLDKDTSGVVILAKSDAAFRYLTKTFAAHDLTRKYIAFVWGVPNWENADITGNIARSSRNRQKMSLVKTGGKAAHTIVDVVNVWGSANISEFRCTLMTGRTHQIRVHLSAHGFPVLCDPTYGRSHNRIGSVKSPDLFKFLGEHHGQMLHAELLELNHPVTGEKLRFKTRLPDDMQLLKSILSLS